MKGLFVSFEGIEGTGKTTHAHSISAYLQSRGHEVVVTEEPGGTPIGRRIREVLLDREHKEMHYLTELLLYNAARCQHMNELIQPSLAAGKVVITDRFSDSTIAYQGFGRGIDLKLLTTLDNFVTGGRKPDLTLLLDLDVETGLSRNRSINKVDRIELETIDFHNRVRAGYLELAEREPERIRIIEVSGELKGIQDRIITIVDDFLDKWN